MTNSLNAFLSQRKKQKFATDTGTEKHSKMQKIFMDIDLNCNNNTLIEQIKSKPELLPFFLKNSQTEVPIAGIINGKFISRRIDRLVKNEADKSIVFLDYKTDINKSLFREKYVYQMREYSELLKKIYPDYSIRGLILWLQDFTLEKIC
ncbi:MAG: hypothetical protein JW974_00465 [Alphaproteobacteria bacterium]|nr:hypothetical protein [Alphaproteobacteria bacterium]MBN2675222.1 hypothetical protein [Alphaproteobacteria bacterium]